MRQLREPTWLLTHPFISFWLAFCWVSSLSWARVPEDRPKAGRQQPELRLPKGVVSCYSWSCLVVGCLMSFPVPVRVAKECVLCWLCQLFVLSAWCFSETFSLWEGLKTLLGFCSALEQKLQDISSAEGSKIFATQIEILWPHFCQQMRAFMDTRVQLPVLLMVLAWAN